MVRARRIRAPQPSRAKSSGWSRKSGRGSRRKAARASRNSARQSGGIVTVQSAGPSVSRTQACLPVMRSRSIAGVPRSSSFIVSIRGILDASLAPARAPSARRLPPRAARRGGDLADQLVEDGVAEILETVDGDDEGARPADHVVAVVGIEIGLERQDRQPVDDDAGG